MSEKEIKTKVKNFYKDVFVFLLNNPEATKLDRQEHAKILARKYFSKLTLSTFRLSVDLMEQQKQIFETYTKLAKHIKK